LIDMKAEPFLIVSCLNMVVAQRLIRKICDHCRQEIFLSPEAEKEVIEMLSKPYLEVDLNKYRDKKTGKLKFYRGVGCSYCNHEGYKGRVALYEILEMTPQLKEILTSERQMIDIEKEAKRQKMMTMLENGYLKALEKVTTIEEVLKAARD